MKGYVYSVLTTARLRQVAVYDKVRGSYRANSGSDRVLK